MIQSKSMQLVFQLPLRQRFLEKEKKKDGLLWSFNKHFSSPTLPPRIQSWVTYLFCKCSYLKTVVRKEETRCTEKKTQQTFMNRLLCVQHCDFKLHPQFEHTGAYNYGQNTRLNAGLNQHHHTKYNLHITKVLSTKRYASDKEYSSPIQQGGNSAMAHSTQGPGSLFN